MLRTLTDSATLAVTGVIAFLVFAFTPSWLSLVALLVAASAFGFIIVRMLIRQRHMKHYKPNSEPQGMTVEQMRAVNDINIDGGPL
jgi:cell division protein FtsW (lipid II flippase)